AQLLAVRRRLLGDRRQPRLDLPGVVGDALPDGCGRRAEAAALQQPHPQLLLELGDRVRDRRLRQAQLERRLGEAAVLDDREQRAQALELHAGSVAAVRRLIAGPGDGVLEPWSG